MAIMKLTNEMLYAYVYKSFALYSKGITMAKKDLLTKESLANFINLALARYRVEIETHFVLHENFSYDEAIQWFMESLQETARGYL